MRSWILTAAAAAALALALPTPRAEAGTVLEATVKDGYVASLYGLLRLSVGYYRNWFGGDVATPRISATLTNFESTVTGTTGINTQAPFAGDIFAEAATYAPAPKYWKPTEYIKFSFDELYVEGLNGAYLAAGRGSTMPNMGKIYNYNGKLLVNFWMDRVTFNSPYGTQSTFTTGDWITVVLDHSLTGGHEPIPEPSTYAMMAISLLGLGFWMQRRRRLRAPAAA